MSTLLLVTIVFWLLHGIGRLMERRTGFFVRRNYMNDKMNKVLELPTKWHKYHHSGDTIDKVNRASFALEEFSSHMTFMIVYTIVNFLGAMAILFLIDWQIGLFSLVSSLITIGIIVKVDKNLYIKYKRLNLYSNKLSAAVFDYLSNVATVITLRLKDVVLKEVDTKQMASYPTYRKTVVLSESKWAVASIAISAITVSALVYRSSTEFMLTGTILVGTLYMLYGYLERAGETFYRFAEAYGQIVRYNARIVGAYPLDEAYAKVGTDKAGRLPKNWREILFKNVSFTYDEKGKIRHLDNINLRFKHGQKIALVGESGSGKSTVLSLIRGLYRIEHGSIYCDGKLLKGDVLGIKDHVTLIPQEPEIFNKTFRYNITMNLPVSDYAMRKAIETAQLKSVIKKLAKGLDTNVLEKGVSLSGGEKQRLALARGLLAAMDSDILLLDEPTSSVDNINEIRIHKQIFRGFRDKTIIASIHRLHLLDSFDYIYLFSNGKIIGEGNHEELKKNPTFRMMLAKYGKEKKGKQAA